MIVAAVVAELADLATYSPAHEFNPLVVGLGPWAPVVKILLVVVLIALAAVAARADVTGRRAIRAALWTATVVGAFGAWSNVA